MTDRTTNLLLKAEVDQGAASAGVAALRQLQAAQNDLVDSVKSLRDTLGDANDPLQKLRDTLDLFGDTGEEALTKVDDKAKQLKQDILDAQAAIKETQLSPSDADFGGSDSSDGGGSISSRGIGALGMLARQSGASGVGNILRTVAELERAKAVFSELGDVAGPAIESLGGLGAVFPPLAIAVGAVTAGVIAFNAVEAQHKTDIDNEIAQTDAYYKAIETGTTQSIELELQKQKIVMGHYQEEFAAIRARIELEKQAPEARLPDAAGNALVNTIPGGGLVNLFTGVGNTVGDKLNPAMADLQKQSDALAKQINDTQNAIVGETKALHSSQVAANDAAEAEKKLQDTRDQLADESVRRATQDQQLIDSASSKSVEDRIASIETEKKAIDAQLASQDLSTQEVEKLTKSYIDLGQEESDLTDNVLPLIKAREDETQAVKEADAAWKSFQNTLKQLGSVTDNINKMISDQATKVKSENDAATLQASRAATEADYQARIDAAKRQEAEQAERDKVAQADADALTKFNDEKAKIVANGFDAELKAYQGYIDAEKRQTDQANKQRLQTLEKAQMDLRELAAAGDVAGFVKRSDQAKLDLKNQAENADAAQKQLYDNYEKQVQTARDAQAKQLNDLQVSYDREKAIRDAAADQRIQQIEDSGKEANTKSAELERQLAALKEQWRQDDLKRQRDQEAAAFEERLQLERDKQNELLAQSAQFFDEWIKDMSNTLVPGLGNIITQIEQTVSQGNPLQTAGNILSDAANTVSSWFSAPQMAGGIDYVPSDHYPAYLDRGERVLTAAENAAYSGGASGGGQPINVTVNNTVGDIATKSMLDDYQQTTIDGVKTAFVRAKGRGN